MLGGLLKVAASDPKLKGLASQVGEASLHITGIDQARPWAIGTLAHHAPVLVVTASGREAEDLTAELTAMLGDKVAYFPAWETLPHERLSPAPDIVGKRARVLDLVGAGKAQVVVTSARGYCQPILSKVEGRAPIFLKEEDEHELSDILSELEFRAYKHVDMVAKRGEYATRGGILDVFPTTSDYPVRVEFWGDEITDIRQFSVADQRAIPEIEVGEVAIYPARELPITNEVAARARELAQKFGGNAALAELLTKVGEHIPAEGMEAVLAVLAAEPFVTLPELLAAGTHVLLVAPEKIRTRIADLESTDAEFLAAGWEAAAMGADGPLAAEGLDTSASSYRSYESLEATCRNIESPLWTFAPPGMFAAAESETLPLDFEPGPTPRGDIPEIDAMMAQLLAHTTAGGRAAFIAPAQGAIKRMVERFAEKGIPTKVATPGWEPSPGEVTLYQALSHAGLVFPKVRKLKDAEALPLVVITETDLTGNRVGDIAGAKRRPAKRRNRVDPLALKQGDYVVHETHGIGKFLKMAERTVQSGDETSRREYIVLEYAASKRGQPADQLWVPMDSLDLLSKYTGGEAPTLSKMGGSDWSQTKSKARRAVREIAGELVKLYSARMASRGHAFAPDTPWQAELEAAFPFVETPDQLTTIDEVKKDMESEVPMDRLISGDVGFGKTEVAVRAAFKAVQDGKQVAVLVPTTLLARQHFETFTERFAGFPVVVRALSRFQTAKESKETLDGLADGSVDVVIGTHRLLSKQVAFKDLGLIIVDEEQRFGVEHKEQLKKLRTNVDVLAMSATPIPRTLEMSLTGIRETSTLATPPEERHPVLTYVGPYTDKQVVAAIRRELMREGQVFYVHNRVSSIDKVAGQLAELVPEARIAVAHGRMSESRLEQIMVDFWEGRYDVLVSTTIIETGLDIANANTLIVDRANNYGLSQLHQLRGRVGRGRDRAYAYFLWDPERPLGEVALERLKAVAAHNELGSGHQLAMKDLELRGAGNLLGGEQSGHIQGVGFDLYIRLVGEAVAAFKGDTDSTSQEMKIELPLNAHFPEDYVPSERLRLEAYRKLAQAAEPEAVDAVVEELKDRYGELPEAAQLLVSVARVRIVARSVNINEIQAQGNYIRFAPDNLAESRVMRMKRLYPGAMHKPALKAVLAPFPKGQGIGAQRLTDQELLDWVETFLTNVFGEA